jgi:hypothetical protein
MKDVTLVFLNPPDELRRRWKVQRDCSRRGYTTDQVLAELDRGEPDSEAFIRPQRRHADLVVSFKLPDATDGLDQTHLEPGCNSPRICALSAWASSRSALSCSAPSLSLGCGLTCRAR